MQKMSRIFMAMYFICFMAAPQIANSGYVGPEDVVVGNWGSADNQFSFEQDDMMDFFPTTFYVLSDQSIAIADNKIKLFKNGILQKAFQLNAGVVNFCDEGIIIQGISSIENGSGDTNIYFYSYQGTLVKSYPSQNIVGSIVSVLNNCDLISQESKDKYRKYSPLGVEIQRYNSKPLELGLVTRINIGAGKSKINVKFADATYQYISDFISAMYYRDANQYLYGIEQLNDGTVISHKVHKYTKCGKEISILTLPKKQMAQVPREKWDYPSIAPSPLVEYGEPMVANSGDIYTWKRTPDKYSILKWTWVDDPNVPTGPDAPTGLTAMPSTTGIYLTWKASPQDPGCVTGYEIARATTSGGTFTTLPPIEKGVVKYNDTTVEAGQQYYYKVRAKAGSEYSQYTSEIPARR